MSLNLTDDLGIFKSGDKKPKLIDDANVFASKKPIKSYIYDALTMETGRPVPDKVFNEPDFQRWYKGWSSKMGLNPNPDDPRHYYDYRAAYMADAIPDTNKHWPSEFKAPSHPNRFVDDIDTITGKRLPTISALTPEKEAKSRRLTDAEIKQYETHKNIELAKTYPKNYLTGSSARIESFAKGLLPIAKEAPPDVEQAYPITYAAGQLAGLLPSARLVRGLAPAVTAAKTISSLPTIARIAAGKAAQTGAAFGIKEFIDNMAEMYAGEDKTAGEIVKKTIKSTAFGAGLGVAGTPASPFIRIPSEMGYGFMTAKIEGADNLHAGINAGLFGLFGLLNTKNLSEAYKIEAYNGSKRALIDRLAEKGVSAEKASTMADRYFQYAMNRTGGWKNTTIKDFDAFSKAMKKGWNIIVEPEMGATNPPPTQPIPPTLIPPTTSSGTTVTPTEPYGPTDILPPELQVTTQQKLIKKPDTTVSDYMATRGDVSAFDLATHGLLDMTPEEITSELTSRLTKAGVSPEIIKDMDIRRPSDINAIKKTINGTMLQGVSPQVLNELHKVKRVLVGWQDEQTKKLVAKNKNILIQMREEINSGEQGKRIYSYDTTGQGGTTDVRGIPSTYPEYFRNKGLVAKDTISLIDRLIKGERLAEGQQAVIEDLIRDKRSHLITEMKSVTEKRRQARRQTEQVPAGLLDVGDTFNKEGEKHQVVGIDGNGNRIIKNGKTIVAGMQDEVPIDKGWLKGVRNKPLPKGVIPSAEEETSKAGKDADAEYAKERLLGIPPAGSMPPVSPEDVLANVPQLIGSTVNGGTIRLQFDNAYKVPTPEEIKLFAKSKGYDVEVQKFKQDIISGTQGTINYRLDVFTPDGSITSKGAQELSKEFGGTFRTKTIAEQALPLDERMGRAHTKMGENIGIKTKQKAEDILAKELELKKETPIAEPPVATNIVYEKKRAKELREQSNKNSEWMDRNRKSFSPQDWNKAIKENARLKELAKNQEKYVKQLEAKPVPPAEAPKGIDHPKIQPNEKINAITLDEAGKLIAKGDPEVIHSIQEGVKAKGSLAMQDAIRNEIGLEILHAHKGAEREAVQKNIMELEPEINEALKGKEVTPTAKSRPTSEKQKLTAYGKPAEVMKSEDITSQDKTGYDFYLERVKELPENEWIDYMVTQSTISGHTADDVNKMLEHYGLRRFRRTTEESEMRNVLKDVYKKVKMGGKDDFTIAEQAAGYGEPLTEPAKPFYSQMQRILESKLPNKGHSLAFRSMIKNWAGKEFKQEEYKWSGVDEWLSEQKGTVTKQGVLDWLKENEVRVEEVEKGDNRSTMLSDWGKIRSQLVSKGISEAIADNIYRPNIGDGDTYYTEKAIKLGVSEEDVKQLRDSVKLWNKNYNPTKFSQYTLPGASNYRELLLTLPEDPEFRSSHWNEQNILAHIRFNERNDADGNRILFIEEMQSDWAAEGRRSGFKDEEELKYKEFVDFLTSKGENIGTGGVSQTMLKNAGASEEMLDRWYSYMAGIKGYAVPNAPLLKNWQELTLKRMLRYAAENGFDKVAWTTGAMQQARYDLSKHVDEVVLEGHSLKAYKKNELSPVLDKNIKDDSEVEDYIGKEPARRLLAQEGKPIFGSPYVKKSISGLDLKIGGKWAENLYDQMIPQFLNKHGKKWGIKSELKQQDYIEVIKKNDGWYVPVTTKNVMSGPYPTKEAAQTVPIIPITPSMKQSVLYEGQALYEKQAVYNRRPDYDQQTYNKAKAKLDRISDKSGGVGTGGRDNIARELIKNNRIDLRGQQAKTSEQIAVISQVFRSTEVETFRIGYVKDGVIAGHEGISSRMPGISSVFVSGEDIKKQLYKILNRAKRLGADEIFFLHNHPTGNPTPSPEDVALTKRMNEMLSDFAQKHKMKVPKFMGHIVIDTSKYSVIRENGQKDEYDLPSEYVSEEPYKYHERISGPVDVVRIGQEVKHQKNFAPIIYRGSDGKVHAIEAMPIKQFLSKDVSGILRNRARAYGARDVFAYYDHLNNEYGRKAIELMKSGVLADALERNGHSVSLTLFKQPSNQWMGIKTDKTTVRVAEEESKYNFKDFITNIRDTRKLKSEGVIVPTPMEVKYFNNAINKYFTYPATLAKRFPKFKKIYERTAELFKERDTIAVGLIKQLEPYFNLTDKSKVNGFLEYARKQGHKLKVTPESMAEYGLSDIEQEAVMAWREAADSSLQMLKDLYMEMSAKIEDPVAQEAYIADVEKTFKELIAANYVPFGRFGDKYLAVMDKEGNLVSYYTSDKQSELVKLSKKYDRDTHTIRIGEILKTSDEAFSEIPLNILTALKKLDADTLGLELSKKLAKELGGFPEHLIHAKMTPGYTKAFERSIANYAIGISNYIAHKKARRDYMDMIAKINPKSERGLYEYAKEYTEYIGESRPEAYTLRKLMFYYYIGPNIKTNLVNLTQTFTTTYPVLSRYTKSPELVTLKALKLYKDYMLHRTRFTESNPELAKAIQEAITDGTISEQMVRELQGRSRPDKLNTAKLDKIMGAMMAAGEHINRTTAFIAGFNVAKKDGKTYSESVRFAEQLSNDTQFIYSKLNRPKIMRGRRASLFIFRNFTGSYLSLLKEAGREKEWGQVVRMLVTMGLLAGIGGYVGVKELFKALEIGGVDVKTAIKEAIPGTAGDVVLHGFPWLVGADLSGSIGVGELVPDIEEGLYPAIGKGVLGVVADIPARAIKSGTRLREGQPYRAVESLMPEWIRNPMVANRWAGEDVRYPSGKRIAIPTMGDIALKSIGIQPSRVSSAYERENAERLLKKGAYSGDINRRYAKAIFLGDEEEKAAIRHEIERYNKGARPEKRIRLNPKAVRYHLAILKSDESEIKQMPKNTRERYRELQDIYKQ